MTVGGLFDGCGLLAYGLHLAGFEHLWLCEKDEFRRELLALRFPGVPIYADVAEVDERAARPVLIAGGFPCKGVSAAGRREGFGHPETVLWREQLRVIRQLRPRYVLVENVADLLTLQPDGGERGDLMGEVLGGLAEVGYDAEWDCFPAAAFGAPHGRDRVFITAAADAASLDGRDGLCSRGPAQERLRRSRHDGREDRPAADAEREPGELQRGAGGVEPPLEASWSSTGDRRLEPAAAGGAQAVEWGEYRAAIERWTEIVGRPAPEPLLRRMDDGSAGRLDRPRLSALGDGVLVQAGWLCGRRIIEHAGGLS